MSKPRIERRENKRHPVTGRVELIILENASIHRGELKNLSADGIFVEMEDLPTAYTNSKCMLRISGSTEESVIEICAQAMIIRVVEFGVGIYIYDIDQDTREALVDLILLANTQAEKFLTVPESFCEGSESQ